MAELFTLEEVERCMREAVRDAGGAKKWLRKKKLGTQYDHVLHMIEDGRAATLTGMLAHVGFERVNMFKPIGAE